MDTKELRKRRIKAVRTVLKKPLSKDMQKYWLKVLQSIDDWSTVKHNAGILK